MSIAAYTFLLLATLAAVLAVLWLKDRIWDSDDFPEPIEHFTQKDTPE